MNMKKTFAGAMAGALAVSAMATSASAAKIPAPGSVDIDLTKEAEFYATVQFTFDADYMLEQGAEKIVLNVDALEGSDAAKLFNLYAGVKQLSIDFIGSTGVKTQTVTYNDTWNDENFYDWYFTLKDFVIPVNYNVTAASKMQGLYVSKYNTVREALAVAASDGTKKYPVSIEALKNDEVPNEVLIKKDGTFVDYEVTNENLDLPFFDRIVVTAKIPMLAKSDLSTLNSASNTYKTNGLQATMKGITPIDIFEFDNEDAMEANKKLHELTAAQVKILEAAVKLDELNVTLESLNAKAGTNLTAAYGKNSAVSDSLAAIGKSTTVTNKVKELANTAKSQLEAFDKALNDVPSAYRDVKPDRMAELVDAQKKLVESYKLSGSQVVVDVRDGKSGVEYAYIDTMKPNAVNAHVHGSALHDVVQKSINGNVEEFLEVCDVDGDIYQRYTTHPHEWKYTRWITPDYAVAIAETKYTKTESNKVGVKSGVTIDNGTVKTLAGDIGAWKPDALRQIADAIADYEGVTLTFTAKDEFDDATYRNWLWGWEQYVENVVGGQNTGWKYAYNNHYTTENVKDDYEEWGESMFTGAIVLNRDFSKQFSQSNLVDWGTKTITFDWDEVTEGRFYDASVVLHTLEILSTQNVEWVSCTVAIPEQGEAEVVDPSQGATDNSDEITDAPVVTDAPEVITEATTTEATTAAPAPAPAPAPNPTTGNAPVALAVIPVALAAAAVVAKKRG